MTLDLNMPGMKGDELMRARAQRVPAASRSSSITGCGDARERRLRHPLRHLRLPPEALRRGAGDGRGRCARRRASTARTRPRRPSSRSSARSSAASAMRTPILDEVDASQKLRGRLGEIFGERGAAPRAARTPRDRSAHASSSSRCSPRRSRPRTASCAATRAASRFYAGLLAERLGLPAEEQRARAHRGLPPRPRQGRRADGSAAARRRARARASAPWSSSTRRSARACSTPLDAALRDPAGDPPSPRVVGRHGLSRRARRRGDPARARASSASRTPSTR